jgi:hypothetical protein
MHGGQLELVEQLGDGDRQVTRCIPGARGLTR